MIRTAKINGKEYVSLISYKRLSTKCEKIQKTLEHRDSVLSVMWDLVRTTITTDKDIIEMIKAVIDCEVWRELTDKQKKLVDKFWNREF